MKDFSRLKITDIHQAEELLSDGWPDVCVSLVDVNKDWPQRFKRHLVIHVDDFIPRKGVDPFKVELSHITFPTREMIDKVIDLAWTIKEGEKVLVHCHGGISRSPATMIGMLCLHGWKLHQAVDIASNLTKKRMWPNLYIIKHFDDALGLKGELSAMVTKWKDFKVSFHGSALIRGEWQ